MYISDAVIIFAQFRRKTNCTKNPIFIKMYDTILYHGFYELSTSNT